MKHLPRSLTACLFTAAVLVGLSGPAMALTLGFDVIQPQNSTNADLAQVDLTVDITAQSNRLYFAFNNSSLDATIGEIYFEDPLGLLSNGMVEYGLSTGRLNYVIGSVAPPVLPGGNNLTPSFDVSPAISADSKGANANGIDQGETLVLSYLGNLDDLATAYYTGNFRIGLHVRSIGAAGKSDSFIAVGGLFDPNTIAVVPEPATMSLLALGIAGIAFQARRRRA